MGYSVLYIAFGIVALWLLGEVLLQYKARLRWRVLAFGGFMGVVGGVYLREVVVIVLGAVAFAVGQAFVTLSYKRGFSTGWALGGQPGSSRRRKGGARLPAEPVLQVTPVEEDTAATGGAGAADLTAAHAPQGPPDRIHKAVRLDEESDEYPLYNGQSSYTPDPYTSGGYEGYGAQGYAGWGETPPAPAAAAAYGYGTQDGHHGEQTDWGGQEYGYAAAGYQEQQAPLSHDYGYETQAAGDWTPHPEPQPQPQPWQDSQPGPWPVPEPQQAWQVPQPEPQVQQQDAEYGYGYPSYAAYQQDPQQEQPYIPQQQHQPPYEQPPQYAPYGEHGEYADPYDPYRS